jgi:hypothetical protein
MFKSKKIISIFVFCFFLLGCGLKTETFKELYNEDLSKVTRIDIRSGRTGELKIITDKQVVENFLGKIKEMRFVPNRKQEKVKGNRYLVTFYAPNRKRFQFTESEVNGHYYQTYPDLLPLLNKFFMTN